MADDFGENGSHAGNSQDFLSALSDVRGSGSWHGPHTCIFAAIWNAARVFVVVKEKRSTLGPIYKCFKFMAIKQRDTQAGNTWIRPRQSAFLNAMLMIGFLSSRRLACEGDIVLDKFEMKKLASTSIQGSASGIAML